MRRSNPGLACLMRTNTITEPHLVQGGGWGSALMSRNNEGIGRTPGIVASSLMKAGALPNSLSPTDAGGRFGDRQSRFQLCPGVDVNRRTPPDFSTTFMMLQPPAARKTYGLVWAVGIPPGRQKVYPERASKHFFRGYRQQIRNMPLDGGPPPDRLSER